MSDNELSNEDVHGYEIKRAIVFENNRGFALAENPQAVQPFVTWQLTEEADGQRDYYWGHYATDGKAATRDYENRVVEYQRDYDIPEKSAYKYYSTQRPVDISTFPKTDNGPLRFVNFDMREEVEQGRFKAWGFLVYDAPLTEKQMGDYELRAALCNPGIADKGRAGQPHEAKKTIAAQLAEGTEQAKKDHATRPVSEKSTDKDR